MFKKKEKRMSQKEKETPGISKQGSWQPARHGGSREIVHTE